MSIHKVYIPIFKGSQVNKELDENEVPTGKIFSEKQVIQDNISSAVSSAFDTFGDEETIIFMCVRKKCDDDSQIGIACFPISGEENVIDVHIPKMEMKSQIVITGKVKV